MPSTASEHVGHEHVVHEAVGGPVRPLEAAAALIIGVNALIVFGVQAVMLGALADAGRLSAAGIGQTATLESLAMGAATALAGTIRRPRRLRLTAAACTVILALCDLACMGAGAPLIMATRALAGAVEGVLLWVTVCMIARTVTPERWAGVFFTLQVLGQFALALAFGMWVLPRWGPSGGFVALGVVNLAGLALAPFAPRGFEPLPVPEGEGGAPPPRGWIALIASFLYVSASGAAAVYLIPIAHEAGLSAGVARTANWVSLAAQVAGGASATALAGKVRWYAVFVITSATFAVGWWIYGHSPTAPLFIAAQAAGGYVAILLGPFLVPFTIEADPSRRAAMQSGSAQVLGGAMGPWLASLVVGQRNARAVLILSGSLLALGFSIVTTMRFGPRRLAGAGDEG
ncbi:MAG TPA: hypothetical protein VGS12_15875 [Caulobacteraceae bacterium]|nr:hypothetical protein [Caulobacteraceae bacterium]